ncbi:MAG: serine/threonine protein kinase [Myxococcaceae bacterium]
MRRAPTRFGKYVLLERLSIGGMAEIFCAKTAGVDRLLALKRVLPHLAEDDEFVQMFVDEARVCSVLKHPNIMSTLDSGQYEGVYFLATEYIAGKDLSSILKRSPNRDGRMPIDLAVHVAVCVAAGLSYAHRRKGRDGSSLNIIHRDVSPPNIMCSWDGEVKLIDFGIAKSAGRTQKQTGIGMLKGKIGYMSPEQAQGRPIDQRVDVFALGAVLYELVTGKQLFEGTSEFELVKKACASKIVPPSKHNPQLPRGLEKVILRALAKELDDRFPSAAALHDALIQVMPGAADEEAGVRLSEFVRGIFGPEFARDRKRVLEASKVDAASVPAPRRHSIGELSEEFMQVSDSDLIEVEDEPDPPFREEALTELHQIPVDPRSGAGRAAPARGAGPRRPRPGANHEGPTVRVSVLSIKRRDPKSRRVEQNTEPIRIPDFDIDED